VLGPGELLHQFVERPLDLVDGLGQRRGNLLGRERLIGDVDNRFENRLELCGGRRVFWQEFLGLRCGVWLRSVLFGRLGSLLGPCCLQGRVLLRHAFLRVIERRFGCCVVECIHSVYLYSSACASI
jgi:hypothetical protein